MIGVSTRSVVLVLALCLGGGCGGRKTAAGPEPATAKAAPTELPKVLRTCLHPDATEWLLTATEPRLERGERYARATAMYRGLSEGGGPKDASYPEASHTLLLYRSLALEPVTDDFGLFAVQFYLDVLNVLLVSRPAEREVCLLAGQNDLDAFMAKYCARGTSHPDDCATFARLHCALDGRPAKDCPATAAPR
ncbi:MAG: hypothetical protein IT373_07545 [Polyangiaceae bacterium]|nr:hypothetical protein [Polyangiaceae bacterium]